MVHTNLVRWLASLGSFLLQTHDVVSSQATPNVVLPGTTASSKL
jgi:hypothetical protein